MLVMIRHGATKSNQEHRYLGKTEESLCEDGIRELQQYKAQQRYPEVDCLFVSPMQRCVQTAGILYPHLRQTYIEEWREIDFGAFEGKNYMDLQEDERYQRWIDAHGMSPFPEGEGRDEFVARCEKGFRKMVRQVRRAEVKTKIKTVGMVVHGGTIMALLSRYCGGEYFGYQTANATGYVCTYNQDCDGPRLTGLKKL